jgi:hypothetical protein
MKKTESLANIDPFINAEFRYQMTLDVRSTPPPVRHFSAEFLAYESKIASCRIRRPRRRREKPSTVCIDLAQIRPVVFSAGIGKPMEVSHVPRCANTLTQKNYRSKMQEVRFDFS